MKFAFADIRSRCTELTAATARIPIQTPRKPTVSSVIAKHSKNAKLLTVSPDCVFNASLVPETCSNGFADSRRLTNKFLESRATGNWGRGQDEPIFNHAKIRRPLTVKAARSRVDLFEADPRRTVKWMAPARADTCHP
jgi:hypothetical protein